MQAGGKKARFINKIKFGLCFILAKSLLGDISFKNLRYFGKNNNIATFGGLYEASLVESLPAWVTGSMDGRFISIWHEFGAYNYKACRLFE